MVIIYMSFSSDVKKELLKHNETSRHCKIAELGAFINTSGCLKNINGSNFIKFQFENFHVAERCFNILLEVFNIKSEILIKNSASHIKKSSVYLLKIFNKKDVKKLFNSTGIIDENNHVKKQLNHITINSICCKRAYIKGAFLCSGYVCDPEKTYHMEFVNDDFNLALQLKNLINSFNIDSKVIERKGHFIVYIKEGEQIVDILNIMSAHNSLMNLENVRIIKDVRNNINRMVNCETANLKKVISASVKQRNAIEYIEKTVGLDYLSIQLKEVAEIRLKYPDMSLKELGEMLVPPVGKSGVNHRLKKICAIAKNLRG